MVYHIRQYQPPSRQKHPKSLKEGLELVVGLIGIYAQGEVIEWNNTVEQKKGYNGFPLIGSM